MHRLDRHRPRAGCWRPDSLCNPHIDTDGDPFFSDPQPDAYFVYEYSHADTDVYTHADYHLDEHAIPDTLCTGLVYAHAHTNALANANDHSLSHADVDSQPDDDTLRHPHADRDTHSLSYSISINDGYPPISEVTDLCFRSFGL